MKIETLLSNIEMLIEIEELRKLGLSQEEITGYFDFYADVWLNLTLDKKDTYAN